MLGYSRLNRCNLCVAFIVIFAMQKYVQVKNKSRSTYKLGRMNKIFNETVQYRGDVSSAPIYFAACINCFVMFCSAV